MSAAFTPLPAEPSYIELRRRLFVVVDVCRMIQGFASQMVGVGEDHDGKLYLTHAAAERAIQEANEVAAALETLSRMEEEES